MNDHDASDLGKQQLADAVTALIRTAGLDPHEVTEIHSTPRSVTFKTTILKKGRHVVSTHELFLPRPPWQFDMTDVATEGDGKLGHAQP